jgi:hypothetical protein
LDAQNELMLAAFDGVYLISVDVDEWGWGISGTGYEVPVIPIFFGVGEDGEANGRVIDGGAWGANIPENMAPPLGEFFHP